MVLLLVSNSIKYIVFYSGNWLLRPPNRSEEWSQVVLMTRWSDQTGYL